MSSYTRKTTAQLQDELTALRHRLAILAPTAASPPHAPSEASEALMAQEAAFRLCLEHLPAAVAIFDRNMRYVTASQRWLADYHLDASILGRSHYDVLPDLPERWKAVHRRCLAGASEERDADCMTRLDGTVQWLHWAVGPWYDSTGAIGGLIVMTKDITARKQEDAALRTSAEHVRLALAAAEVGLWWWEPDTDRAYWDAHVRAMWGVASDRPINRTVLASLLHPEDRQRTLEVLDEMLHGRTSSCAMEFRTLHADGTVRWIDTRAGVIPGTLECPTRLIGVNLDMTARKQAEEALRASEARYWTLFAGVDAALCEANFSAVAEGLHQLRSQGVTDLETYLAMHPETVAALCEGIQLLEANPVALRLFEVESTAQLRASRLACAMDAKLSTTIACLVAIACGDPSCTYETVCRTLTGRCFPATCSMVVVPSALPYQRVLVTMTDRTAHPTAAPMRAQRAAAHRGADVQEAVGHAVAPHLPHTDQVPMTPSERPPRATSKRTRRPQQRDLQGR